MSLRHARTKREQIAEIVRLVEEDARIPSILFSKQLPVRISRMIQILFGIYRLLVLVLRREAGVIICGEHLHVLEGSISISSQGVGRRALASLKKLESFIIVPVPIGHPLERLTETLDVDPADEIEARLSINSVLIFSVHREGLPVIVHVGFGSKGLETLERHRRGLQGASVVRRNPALLRLVPECLSHRAVNGHQILVQERLSGAPVRVGGLSEAQLQKLILAAFEPLLTIFDAARTTAAGPCHDFIFSRFPAWLEARPDLRDRLHPSLEALQSWPRRVELPTVATHGDYWIGNVLFDCDQPRVAGIVDWERFNSHGCPASDALHLALISYRMWDRGMSVGEGLRQIWTKRWRNEFLRDYFKSTGDAFGLRDEGIGYVALLVWFGRIQIKYMKAPRVSPRWIEDNVDRTAAAAEHWLSRNTKPVTRLPRASESLGVSS